MVSTLLPLFPRQFLTPLNPFRTAVPFWGQTTQASSSLFPKRDFGSNAFTPSRSAFTLFFCVLILLPYLTSIHTNTAALSTIYCSVIKSITTVSSRRVLTLTLTSPACFAPVPTCRAPIPLDHIDGTFGSHKALLGILLVEVILPCTRQRHHKQQQQQRQQQGEKSRPLLHTK